MEIIVKPARVKRRHSEAFRQAVVAACCEPGASVAGIALANGLNANLVRKWLRLRGIELPGRRQPKKEAACAVAPSADFVPVQVLSAPAPSFIHLELCRGGSTVRIDWPLIAIGECASWLRECLQ